MLRLRIDLCRAKALGGKLYESKLLKHRVLTARVSVEMEMLRGKATI